VKHIIVDVISNRMWQRTVNVFEMGAAVFWVVVNVVAFSFGHENVDITRFYNEAVLKGISNNA